MWGSCEENITYRFYLMTLAVNNITLAVVPNFSKLPLRSLSGCAAASLECFAANLTLNHYDTYPSYLTILYTMNYKLCYTSNYPATTFGGQYGEKNNDGYPLTIKSKMLTTYFMTIPYNCQCYTTHFLVIPLIFLLYNSVFLLYPSFSCYTTHFLVIPLTFLIYHLFYCYTTHFLVIPLTFLLLRSYSSLD